MNQLLGRVQPVVPASEVPEELVDQVMVRRQCSASCIRRCVYAYVFVHA